MLLSAAADLLLGGCCLGCGRAGWWLCGDCRDELRAEPRRVWRVGFPEPIWAASDYRGAVRRLLPAYKDAQAMQLARPLGVLLAASIVAAGARADIALVPLSSARASARARGYQHMQRLVRAASSRLTPAPLVLDVLRADKAKDQQMLTAEQRRANLANTMRARPGRGSVIVCDDIVTTGASLVEARRALREAGYEVYAAAVVATTALRRDADSGNGGTG